MSQPVIEKVIKSGRNEVPVTITVNSPTSALVEVGTNEVPVNFNGVPHRGRAWFEKRQAGASASPTWVYNGGNHLYRTDMNFGLGEPTQTFRSFVFNLRDEVEAVVASVETEATLYVAEAALADAERQVRDATEALALALAARDDARTVLEALKVPVSA